MYLRMSAGLVVVAKATVLLFAVQFIQDAEGQFYETTLDICISSMVREQSLEGLKDKLSKDSGWWQPSFPESVIYWAEKQIYPEKGECRVYSEDRLKDVIKEIYGRSLVINLAIKASIIGWKTAFLHKAVIILLASDVVESVLEYFDYTTAGKVLGAVWSAIAGGLIGCVLWAVLTETMPPLLAIALGLALGLGPWIYCEICLRNIARLLGSDSYYKSELIKIAMNK